MIHTRALTIRTYDCNLVEAALDSLYEQMKAEYGLKRHFERYQYHLKVFVLDLFACHQLENETVTYITYSRNSSDYAINTGRLKRGRPKKVVYKRMPPYRYTQVRWGKPLSLKITVKVVSFLEKHGYIEHHAGQWKPNGVGQLSRMRATDKLIDLLKDKHGIEIGMYCWDWNEGSPTVILRDKNKDPLWYRSTPEVQRMKENIRIINKTLERFPVLLYILT